MAYLTIEEYRNLIGKTIEESKFNKLLPKASDVIDDITSYYYKFNDLENDNKFRKEQFKKAIASQIQYFDNLGGTSTEEIQSAQSITIGRTSISKGRADSKEDKQSIISQDALMYLRHTGLLYRGIGVRL